jgi:pimeloyl-ACP methyl ester carboxylesterase
MRRAVIIVLGALAAMLLAGICWLWTPDETRGALEARYAVSPQDYVTVAGITLHVRDTGAKNAPAVILLHGFGSSLQTWEPWAKVLEARYRVIRFDLPGFGLTGPDPTGDYSDARSLQVLLALMDRLAIARADLIGNSIGGRIAFEFAARYQARVDRLVLISPDGFASPGFEYGRKPDVPAMIQLMRFALPKAMLRANLLPAYGNPAALSDAVLQRYYDMMRAPGVRGAMIARMQQTVLENPEPILKQVQAPTLLLWGRKDGMIPFANSADYLRLMPNATLTALPELGHVPQEEAPDVSIKSVEAFLAR